jgi:hypothetical protein
MGDEEPWMRRVVSSTVSLWQGQLVDDCSPATESLQCCSPPSHLASALGDFPFFARNYSVVVVRRRLSLVSYVGCYIDISRKSRSHLAQAQVSLLALHLVWQTEAYEDD